MYRKIGLLVVMLLGMSGWVAAQVTLPKLISDNMVLQRDTELTLWGWASPGEPVIVHFKGETYRTSTQNDSTWSVDIPPQKAGGPYNLEINASNDITVKNIMIGEVWLASGQSNMELPMYRVAPLYQDEINSADYPHIRYFNVPQQYRFKDEAKDFSGGNWQVINTEVISSVSAVAYFFAKKLHQQYEVPVGIVNSSLGGSPAEAWMSEEALKAFPAHYHEALRYKNKEMVDNIIAADQSRMNTWFQTSNTQDKGYEGVNWSKPELDDSNWAEITVPGFWDDKNLVDEHGHGLPADDSVGHAYLGDKNGVVWFRKTIDIPEAMAGQEVEMELGRVVDADSTFVNGVFVGNTTYQYPPRWYTIPEGVLKAGKNLITVRVVNQQGTGGFFPDKKYELRTETDTVNLEGTWKYRVGVEMPPLASQTFIRWKPLGLFNGMIAPLLNYRFKGAIWYQGESNVGEAELYAELFPAMIANWRNRLEEPDLPFIYVQLANFMKAYDKPTDSGWARLREAQLKTLQVPNTAMAVAIDVGEWNDIHPLNKQAVGERLARGAQHVAYGEKNIVPMGPIFEKMEKKGNRIELSFKHVGDGLKVKGDKPQGFAIAGTDKEFVWAKAEIKGDKVVVWHPDIENPAAVRYAWADNPEHANLYNKEDLPASPFRTDDW